MTVQEYLLLFTQCIPAKGRLIIIGQIMGFLKEHIHLRVYHCQNLLYFKIDSIYLILPICYLSLEAIFLLRLF